MTKWQWKWKLAAHEFSCYNENCIDHWESNDFYKEKLSKTTKKLNYCFRKSLTLSRSIKTHSQLNIWFKFIRSFSFLQTYRPFFMHQIFYFRWKYKIPNVARLLPLNVQQIESNNATENLIYLKQKTGEK